MSKQNLQNHFVLPMLAVVSMTTIVTLTLFAGLSGAADKFCDQETTPSGYAGYSGVVNVWLRAYGYFALIFTVLSLPFFYSSTVQGDVSLSDKDDMQRNNRFVRIALILFLLMFAAFIMDAEYILANVPRDCMSGRFGDNTAGVIMWIVFIFSSIFVFLFGFFVSPLKSSM